MTTDTTTKPKFSERVELCYKFWLNSKNGQYILSDQRMKLLIDIHELGSLTAAAKKRKLSYRKAWGDIKKSEELLGFALLVTHRGGYEGGGTILTEQAKILVLAYKEFIQAFDEKIKEATDKIIKTIQMLDHITLSADEKVMMIEHRQE
jgi:molybdate transport system regulatory protein